MSVRMKSEIDMEAARVSISTLWNAAEMVRKGALTNQVMDAAYTTSEAKFNAYMASELAATGGFGTPGQGGSSPISHVFDWGQTASASGRLWRTWMFGSNSNRFVTFEFQRSKKNVPLHPKLEAHTRRRHVFREKAAILEAGSPVTISRRESNYLVYVARTEAEKKRANKDGIVFQKNPSFVEKAGGGHYENEFTQRFLVWWASDLGAGGELNRIADGLGESFVFQSARTTSALNRVATFKKKLTDAEVSAKGKVHAQKMIKAIQRQMTIYGRRQARGK